MEGGDVGPRRARSRPMKSIQHRWLEFGLEIDVLDLNDPRLPPEHGAGNRALAALGLDRHADVALDRRPAARGAPLRHGCRARGPSPAPTPCSPTAGAASGNRQRRRRQRPRVELRGALDIRSSIALTPVSVKLSGEGAELLGELDERRQRGASSAVIDGMLMALVTAPSTR
jgi:hypothetical protein